MSVDALDTIVSNVHVCRAISSKRTCDNTPFALTFRDRHRLLIMTALGVCSPFHICFSASLYVIDTLTFV